MIEIAGHESLHVDNAVLALLASEDLQIDRREVMIWIRIELTLELRQGLSLSRIFVRVWIGEWVRIDDPVNLWILRGKRTEHVIE